MFFYKNQNGDLAKLKTKLLITCPNDSNSIGGLFILDFNKNKLRKIFEGDLRGFSIHENKIYITDEARGVLIFNNQLKLENIIKIKNGDLHGLFVKKNNVYVVETSTDSIGIYNAKKLEKIDKITISNHKNDNHHINDIYIKNNCLYISMFSRSGSWKNKEADFDGVIAKYDLNKRKIVKILRKNLQFPHSIIEKENKMYFCESLNLNLSSLNSTLAKFGGYTRGLCFDNKYFYIGQSEMRHLDRILTKIPNVSLDCGLYIFDPKKQTNKFVPLPAKQIYQILPVKNFSYKFDTKITFNSNFAVKNFKNTDDWHYPDLNYRWMAKKNVSVCLLKEKNKNNLLIETYSGLPHKYLGKVFVNSRFMSYIKHNGPGKKKLKINTNKIPYGVVEIKFMVDKLWKPSNYLKSNDKRKLGLAFKRISFSK